MKEISSHQFILLSIFLLLSTKLLTFQPVVYEFSQKDAFWSVLFGAILDILVLFLVVLLLKKHPNITFFELLKNTFGKILAKVITLLMFVFIFLKVLYLAEETFSFFVKFLYEDLNIIVYILPMAFVCGYFSIKGITTISRTIEIFYIFVLLGIVLCALTAIEGVNLDYIFPVFENGAKNTFDGLFAQTFYRGNGLILLMFMGKINFSKHFVLKFMSAKVLITLLILGITFLFYVVYGPSVKYVEFALADLPQYNPFVSDIGRLNWLSVVVCVIALILTTSVMIYCLSLILRWNFNLKRSLLSTGISIFLITFFAYLNEFSIIIMEQKIVGIWQNIIIIPLAIMIFIVLLLLFRRENGKSDKI